jgi:hypothetical protein
MPSVRNYITNIFFPTHQPESDALLSDANDTRSILVSCISCIALILWIFSLITIFTVMGHYAVCQSYEHNECTVLDITRHPGDFMRYAKIKLENGRIVHDIPFFVPCIDCINKTSDCWHNKVDNWVYLFKNPSDYDCQFILNIYLSAIIGTIFTGIILLYALFRIMVAYYDAIKK